MTRLVIATLTTLSLLLCVACSSSSDQTQYPDDEDILYIETDSLIAETHAVMVVNSQHRTVVQRDSSGCILTVFGLGCGTAANSKAVLHGERAVIERHRTLVNQVVEFDFRVLDNESAVILVGGILLTARNVDTVGSRVGSRVGKNQ